MPLKLIPPRGKGKSPNWTIRGTYLGRYVDRSTGTGKRALAAKVLKGIERKIERGELAEPGEPTFASAAANYMKAGGERTYVKKLLERFGETRLSEIGQAEIDAAAVALFPHGSPATRNRSVYTPISAILKHAGTRIDLRRPRGSGGNKATAWLWPEQAQAIFEEAHKLDSEFAALLIVLCGTGLRLSEALNRETIWRLQDAFAYVPDSKSGDPVPAFLPPIVVAALTSLSGWNGFTLHKSGHLYALLKTAAFKAGVDLPERSAFHIFRHTYMTWMRRYAGLDELGLLSLKRHKDSKSVGRYTHVVVSEEARRAVLLPLRGKSVA